LVLFSSLSLPSLPLPPLSLDVFVLLFTYLNSLFPLSLSLLGWTLHYCNRNMEHCRCTRYFDWEQRLQVPPARNLVQGMREWKRMREERERERMREGEREREDQKNSSFIYVFFSLLLLYRALKSPSKAPACRTTVWV
jgi:hypothetical protein